MTQKYPLLLKPVIKDYIWGGRRLIDDFGFETDKDIAAEGWMLACHPDGTNIVTNGELAGKPFDEVLSLWGECEKFPILINLIDASDRLSVQVHPADEYALKNEGEFGKTEMWYIVDCDEGAKLAYGFTKEITKAEFESRIRDNTLDEVINYVPVKKGDVFFISAGTLHAIGAGILISEIQQNSNTTYRVSDYGRLGADGKPRALHVEKALDVTETVPPRHPYGNIGEERELDFGTIRTLAECEYFKSYALKLQNDCEMKPSSFLSILVLSGEITVCYDGGEVTAHRGDSLYIPRGMLIKTKGKAEVIVSEK